MKFVLFLFAVSFHAMLYAQAGELDSAFGLNGSVITRVLPVEDEHAYNSANAVVVQPDGKIVTVGVLHSNGADRIMMARYNEKGELDTSFGTNGIDTLSIKQTQFIKTITLQPDGKIVVAGNATDSIGNHGTLVCRFNTNGTFDSTFNLTGFVFTSFQNHAVGITGIAIQPDGKIVGGGTLSVAGPGSVFLTIKFTKDGYLDTTFNHTGIVNPITKYQSDATGMKLLQNGKIVLCGVQNGLTYALTKLNSDGSTDSSFGVNGYVYGTNNPNGPGNLSWFTNLDEQNDGKLVVSGMYEGNGALAVYRLNENGSFDSSFGKNGVAYTFFDSANYSTPYAVKIEQDGKILAGGISNYTPNSNKFAIARFKNNGEPDSSFGYNHNGKVNNSCDGFSSTAYAMCLAPSRIYLAGIANNGFAVAAYTKDDKILPLKLINFSGHAVNDKVALKWETSNEINIKNFIVEKSNDAVHFFTLKNVSAKIKGAGINFYTTVDSLALNGKNYYRLKLLDNDGSFTYSNTVLITIQDAFLNVRLYPNPCTNNLNFDVEKCKQGNALITVTNIHGTILKIRHLNISSPFASGVMPVQDLCSGVYFLHFYQGELNLTTLFIKE